MTSQPNLPAKIQRRARPLLGTFVEIGVKEFSTEQAGWVFDEAFNAIRLIHDLCSFHDPRSELSRLNRTPGAWIPLHHHTLRTLRLAKGLAARSNGKFNPTVGGILVQQGFLPNHFEHQFFASGKESDLELKPGFGRLTAPVLVTLDGIAKGYAVDLACRKLQQLGVTSGWVNAGGDLKIFGDVCLTLEVRNHCEPIAARNCAVATSRTSGTGSAEFSAVMTDGRKLLPSCDETVSVKSRNAWQADSLTKIMASTPVAMRQQILHRYQAELLL